MMVSGLREANVRPMTIVAVLCVRYLILPVIGIGVVKAVGSFGWLPSDPLFQFVLMLQFCLPPAMNIGKIVAIVYDIGNYIPLFSLVFLRFSALGSKEMVVK